MSLKHTRQRRTHTPVIPHCDVTDYDPDSAYPCPACGCAMDTAWQPKEYRDSSGAWQEDPNAGYPIATCRNPACDRCGSTHSLANDDAWRLAS